MERRFACGKPLNGKPRIVSTRDGQEPWVGADCYRKVVKAGPGGWAPTAKHGRGGPRLYLPDDRWVEVSPDGEWTRWQVHFIGDLVADVITLKTRRDTGLEYSQSLKPFSRNYNRAVILAIEKEAV